MDLLFSGNLTLITFFPLLGILIVLLVSAIFDNSLKHLKIGVLIVSVIEFIISIPLFTKFQDSYAGMQFEQQIPWLTELGVSYHVGVDGISLFLVLLTTCCSCLEFCLVVDVFSKSRPFLLGSA